MHATGIVAWSQQHAIMPCHVYDKQAKRPYQLQAGAALTLGQL